MTQADLENFVAVLTNHVTDLNIEEDDIDTKSLVMTITVLSAFLQHMHETDHREKVSVEEESRRKQQKLEMVEKVFAKHTKNFRRKISRPSLIF